jgi:DNA invertase Pin-like site-specific DNA recombinase
MATAGQTSIAAVLKELEKWTDENGAIPVGKVLGLDGKLRPRHRVDTTERDARIRQLRSSGVSLRAIAESVECSVGTVHRVVNIDDYRDP